VTWPELLEEETELEDGWRVVVEVEPVVPDELVEDVELVVPGVAVLVAVVAATDLVV
jgi:hypothetical protein